MSNEELMRRIRLDEDSALDLKRIELQGRKVKGPSRKDFADELAAFANARGGTIVLGVDDKTREVLGIPLDDLDAVEDWVLRKFATIRSNRPSMQIFIGWNWMAPTDSRYPLFEWMSRGVCSCTKAQGAIFAGSAVRNTKCPRMCLPDSFRNAPRAA